MRISDWSSDVCSSDLFDQALDLYGERGDRARGGTALIDLGDESSGPRRVGEGDALADCRGEQRGIVVGQRLGRFAGDNGARGAAVQQKIGRASCRERVCQYV